MTEEKARILRIAAVQMECKNGQIQENLEHAGPLIDRAAEEGARLILLPEFMPTGYIFTNEIWDSGETSDGPTVSWLKENSRRLGVWLGTSFLEADGDDFFNTFVLTSPDGAEAGRVRKQTPAAFEAFFFKGETGSHVIETEFGKIGVGICYENSLAYLPSLMVNQSADLVLMPHSAPTPAQFFLFPQKAVELYNRSLGSRAEQTAKRLGVPAIMVNKCGPWSSPLPLLGMTQESSFPGLSAIVDSDGCVKASLNDEEDIIVADVTLDPSRKTTDPGPCFGRWAYKEHWSWNIWRVAEFFGGISYSISSERKRKAREISSRGV